METTVRAKLPPAGPQAHAVPAAVLAVAIAAALPARTDAFEIPTSVEGLKVNWDTTLKYSNAFRVKAQDSRLVANPNLDDGDRNFNRGLISNRVDVFTELDAVYRDIGLRFSGAGWFDQIYNGRNDHPGGTANQSGPFNEFPTQTRRLHGRNAELLDAFAFGRMETGAGTLSLRLGRHALLWGESLFFGVNAIAGGQMPVDVTKLVSVPGTQFKEVIRPVPQVSAQLSVSSNVSLGAYYQFRYEPNRFPAVGSYFSQADTGIDGAERILLPTYAAPRQPDQRPKNSGQGGMQLKLRVNETDFGFYAIRFHQKTPQLTPWIGPVMPPDPVIGPVGPVAYMLGYHQSTNAFGASVSRTFGDLNLAAEASVRRGQDLASSGNADLRLLGLGATNNSGNTAYAVGNTAHANLSAFWTLAPGPLWREAVFLGEVAWNRVLSCRQNCTSIEPNATRDGTALRLLFTPAYRQVLPGLDLEVPIGLGYSPHGSRPMALGTPGAMPPEGGGDLSIGLNANWEQVWRFSLNYTHYFGSADTWVSPASRFTYRQYLKDRDFIAFSVRRTF